MSENKQPKQPTWDDLRPRMWHDHIDCVYYGVESAVNWILRHYTLIEKENETQEEGFYNHGQS